MSFSIASLSRHRILKKKPLCSSFFEASKDESKRTEFHNFLDEIKSKESAQLAYLGGSQNLDGPKLFQTRIRNTAISRDGKELIERGSKLEPHQS